MILVIVEQREGKLNRVSWETLTAWLEPLLTESVIRSLTRSDFTPEHIMRGDRPVTVYLRWKEQDLLALSPLVRLLWGSLMKQEEQPYRPSPTTQRRLSAGEYICG